MNDHPRTNEHLRAASERTSLLDLVRRLFDELPGLLGDRVELFKLELRRAGKSFAVMLALGLAAAILLFTAWVAFWIGFAAMLVHFGLPWGWALLIVLALNIGGAVFALLRARALAGNLAMAATRRHLTLANILGRRSRSTTLEPRHEQSVPTQVRSVRR